MAPITLVFCLFLFMFTLSSLSKKTYDDEMTLLEFKSSIFDPNDVLKSWRDDNPNHCSWFGVSCNSNLRVSELKIKGNLSLAPSCLNSELSLHGFGIQRNCSEINGKLVGKLSPMIGNLTDLTVLSLPYNELDGEIPVEILGLKNLQVLDLEGNSLDGHFSSYEFTHLRKLKVLNLAFNRIYGQFPPSLPKCRLLRILNLAGNRINGTIPTYVGGLRNLRVINLSFNRLVGHVPSNLGYGCGNLEHLDLSANFLNGEIPRALGKCNRLRTLLLSSNALNGTIPKELRELRRLEVLDVSRNNRSGPLPEDLGSCTNTSVAYLSFFANQTRPMDRGSSVSPIQQCERHNKTRKHHSHHKSHDESDHVSDNEASLIVLLSFVISLTITSLACIAIYCYAERRRRDPQTNSSYSSPQTSEVTIFHNIGIPLTYDAIVQATQNFSRNCIGAGGFGSTYKAEVSPENVVAIKRLTASRHQGVPQFDAEVSVLGRINHPNLITLIGYYASQAEMFLIYNYLPGGNLDQFIRNRDRHAFDYNILHKISLHIAFALSYLHDECNPRILHRDIKPSNILLDEDYNAYLSDFGLSRILNTNVTHATTRVAGTYGYIAPEYASTGRVSSKADVYSYGVVLLELMSDKRALDPSFFLHYNGFDIVSWVRLLIEERRPEEFFMARLWESGPRDKLIRMLFMAILCTNEFVAVRPPMKEVVRRLEQLQPPTG